MEQPMYQHFTCKTCRFLGRFRDGNHWNDLYVCTPSKCVVARWGSDIDDYYAESIDELPEIREITRRRWPAIAEAHRRILS